MEFLILYVVVKMRRYSFFDFLKNRYVYFEKVDFDCNICCMMGFYIIIEDIDEEQFCGRIN